MFINSIFRYIINILFNLKIFFFYFLLNYTFFKIIINVYKNIKRVIYDFNNVIIYNNFNFLN